MSNPNMSRQEWNLKYAEYIKHRTEGAYTLQDGLDVAGADDTAFNEGTDPVEAAEEEMSYWTDDEEH